MYVAGHMDDVMLLQMRIEDEHQPQFGSEKFSRFCYLSSNNCFIHDIMQW